MIIRQANPNEIPDLRVMAKEILPDARCEASLWLLAEEDGEILGALGIEDVILKRAIIEPIVVKPQHRHRFVAGRLREGLVQLLHWAGVNTYLFAVRKDNEHMLKISRRLGTEYGGDKKSRFFGVNVRR